jgi:hypothetical protein
LVSALRALLSGKGTAVGDATAIREAVAAGSRSTGRTAIPGFCGRCPVVVSSGEKDRLLSGAGPALEKPSSSTRFRTK